MRIKEKCRHDWNKEHSMGFDLKQWLLVLVSMILVGLLVKGYIRMRASRNRIQMKLDKSFVSRVGEITKVDDSNLLKAELPNGGARVIRQGGESVDVEDPNLLKAELPNGGARVIGHLRAGWLERRPARELEERTDLLIANLPLDKTSVVADIGAGTGYFTFQVAEYVKYIFAVDTQQKMVDIIDQRIEATNVNNVVTVKGSITDPRLPTASIDVIFIVDAYHEFSHPYEMGQAMVSALKPGGKLVIIEYRDEDPSVPENLHKMSEVKAVEEMARIGMGLKVNAQILPQQYFLVFERSLD